MLDVAMLYVNMGRIIPLVAQSVTLKITFKFAQEHTLVCSSACISS